MRKGVFITFEGGEGAGKSTQLHRLAKRLRGEGREVVATREPGGSPGAEALRELVVSGSVDRWSPLAEVLIFYAAREDHLQRTVRPALARGAVVISDRFADSSRAYQGAGGGIGEDLLDTLDAAVVGATPPDLTLILDLPVDTGLERAATRGGDDRFEQKGSAFHERLRRAFLRIAEQHPDRCRVIGAARDPDEVAADVWAAVQPVLTR